MEILLIAYPLDVDGIGTRVLESGAGDRGVVFVHGTGGRADRWIRNLDAVAAAGYHAYAMDLPGHGFADKGAGVACSVPAYQAFLGAFLETAGIRRATIVGTSLGGHVVAAWAVSNPERVDAIVLVGSMGLVPIGDEARARIQAGANNQTRDGVNTKLQRVIFDQALVTPQMQEEEFRVNNSAGAKESFKALGDYIAADLDRDIVGEKLAGAPFPVLLVWGEQDKTVPPAAGEKARALLPKSRLALIADAAHTAYYEKPDAFNAVLLRLLAGEREPAAIAGVTWK